MGGKSSIETIPITTVFLQEFRAKKQARNIHQDTRAENVKLKDLASDIVLKMK